MKTLAVLSILLVISSCADNQKADKLVSEYVKEHADDPGSYEPVSFSNARALTYGDISTGKPDAYDLEGVALIEHTFRAKNEFGALIMQTQRFSVDSVGGKVWPLREMQDSLTAFRTKIFETQASQMEHIADSIADARGGY